MSEINEAQETPLKDVLVETMKATLEADAEVAKRYYETLQQYAFENDESDQVKMAHFEVPNADGIMQEISIPQLALMPIPILQVSEATFDLKLEMQIADSNEQVSMQNGDESLKIERTSSIILQNRQLKRQPLQQTKLRRSKFYVSFPKATVLHNMNSHGGASAPGIAMTEEQLEEQRRQQMNSMGNLKVTVKMQQSDLPAGVSTLLQTIANGLQIKTKK